MLFGLFGKRKDKDSEPHMCPLPKRRPGETLDAGYLRRTQSNAKKRLSVMGEKGLERYGEYVSKVADDTVWNVCKVAHATGESFDVIPYSIILGKYNNRENREALMDELGGRGIQCTDLGNSVKLEWEDIPPSEE